MLIIRTFIFLTIFVFIDPINLTFADVKKEEEKFSGSFTPLFKLSAFANVCDDVQVKILLNQDGNFDINAYGKNLTPVEGAINRFIRAINAEKVQFDYQSACQRTIEYIISDERYEWKEISPRKTTDFLHLIRTAISVTPEKERLFAYEILLASVINKLKKKEDFDVNYNITGDHKKEEVGNISGMLAFGGTPAVLCSIKSKLPELNLDNRKSDTHYSSVLIAIQQNRLDMLKALVGNGADWFVQLGSSQRWDAFQLARAMGLQQIQKFLTEHAQGRERGEVCS